MLISERGSNLVVINPGTPPTCSTFIGSANVGAGLAQQDAPFVVPHCIACYTRQLPERNVQDQMLNSQVTTAQHMAREKALISVSQIALLLKIPFLDEEVTNSSSFQRKFCKLF